MIYNISYISLIDKVDEFIRGFDGTRYLVLFVSEKYNYNRIRILQVKKIVLIILFLIITQHSKLIHMIPLEKTWTLHNVIILIKSVFNED